MNWKDPVGVNGLYRLWKFSMSWPFWWVTGFGNGV